MVMGWPSSASICRMRNPHPGRLGVVEAGAIADLILVDGDPVADISLITRPQECFLAIIKGGQLVKGPDTRAGVSAQGPRDASRPRSQSGVQAGDRFRGGGEGGIAGCRVPAPASLDEFDLMRIQAAHGRPGELAAWRAGRARSGDRFSGRV